MLRRSNGGAVALGRAGAPGGHARRCHRATGCGGTAVPCGDVVRRRTRRAGGGARAPRGAGSGSASADSVERGLSRAWAQPGVGSASTGSAGCGLSRARTRRGSGAARGRTAARTLTRRGTEAGGVEPRDEEFVRGHVPERVSASAAGQPPPEALGLPRPSPPTGPCTPAMTWDFPLRWPDSDQPARPESHGLISRPRNATATHPPRTPLGLNVAGAPADAPRGRKPPGQGPGAARHLARRPHGAGPRPGASAEPGQEAVPAQGAGQVRPYEASAGQALGPTPDARRGPGGAGPGPERGGHTPR